MSFWGPFLATLGASLISGKVASNRAKDPKGPIGSGTAPSIQPGEGGGFTPVTGSEVQDFGDFEYENMAEPEMTEEQQLAMLLQQLGMGQEGGVINAAYGKVLKRENGGGIGSLLKEEVAPNAPPPPPGEPVAPNVPSPPGEPVASGPKIVQTYMDDDDNIFYQMSDGSFGNEEHGLMGEEMFFTLFPTAKPTATVLEKADGGGISTLEQIKELFPDIDFMNKRPSSGEIIDFTSIAEPDLADTMVAQLEQDPSNLVQDFSMSFETDTPGIMSDTPELEQAPTGMFENAQIGMENFATDNPETFDALQSGIMDIIMAATRKMPEQKGSQVMTKTLPAGNAARRRSQLENITPLGGSSVTFAKEGKVLQRPMFMPHGGAMHGAGGPKDDLIPVMASNGEYMLSKAAVDAAGDGSHAMGIARLNEFNEMGNQRYG